MWFCGPGQKPQSRKPADEHTEDACFGILSEIFSLFWTRHEVDNQTRNTSMRNLLAFLPACLSVCVSSCLSVCLSLCLSLSLDALSQQTDTGGVYSANHYLTIPLGATHREGWMRTNIFAGQHRGHNTDFSSGSREGDVMSAKTSLFSLHDNQHKKREKNEMQSLKLVLNRRFNSKFCLRSSHLLSFATRCMILRKDPGFWKY